jgi:hypothetical protein
MFFVNEFVCLQPREIHDVILLRHNYSFCSETICENTRRCALLIIVIHFIVDLQLLVLGWEDLYHVLRKYHVGGACELCTDNNSSILEAKSVFGSQFA